MGFSEHDSRICQGAPEGGFGGGGRRKQALGQTYALASSLRCELEEESGATRAKGFCSFGDLCDNDKSAGRDRYD